MPETEPIKAAAMRVEVFAPYQIAIRNGMDKVIDNE